MSTTYIQGAAGLRPMPLPSVPAMPPRENADDIFEARAGGCAGSAGGAGMRSDGGKLQPPAEGPPKKAVATPADERTSGGAPRSATETDAVVPATPALPRCLDCLALHQALEECHAQVRQADRARHAFLAMLAHELRNPLAPIANAVALLQAYNASDPRIRWAASVIERHVQHLRRLVDDLVDGARAATGKIPMRFSRLDLREVVERAVELVRPLIEHREHRLECRLGADPLYVAGDRERLVQACGNLLDNAARYTEAQGSIFVEALGEQRDCRVRVRDTGRGISAELLPHIFEPFVQGERDLNRAEGGLGLGLPFAERIVSLHGGEIAARSAGPGLGAEFELRLPAIAPRDERGCG